MQPRGCGGRESPRMDGMGNAMWGVGGGCVSKESPLIAQKF